MGTLWLMVLWSTSNILSLKKTLINCQIFNNWEVSFSKYLILWRFHLWIQIWDYKLGWFDNMGTGLLEVHSQMGCKFSSLPSILSRLPHCLPILLWIKSSTFLSGYCRYWSEINYQRFSVLLWNIHVHVPWANPDFNSNHSLIWKEWC